MKPVALRGSQPMLGCSRPALQTIAFAGRYNPGAEMVEALKGGAEAGVAGLMHDYGLYLVDSVKIPALKRFLAGSLPINMLKMKNPPDELIAAYQWFTLAQEKGGNDPHVGDNATWLKMLNGLLSDESKEEAARRIQAWRVVHPDQPVDDQAWAKLVAQAQDLFANR